MNGQNRISVIIPCRRPSQQWAVPCLISSLTPAETPYLAEVRVPHTGWTVSFYCLEDLLTMTKLQCRSSLGVSRCELCLRVHGAHCIERFWLFSALGNCGDIVSSINTCPVSTLLPWRDTISVWCLWPHHFQVLCFSAFFLFLRVESLHWGIFKFVVSLILSLIWYSSPLENLGFSDYTSTLLFIQFFKSFIDIISINWYFKFNVK